MKKPISSRMRFALVLVSAFALLPIASGAQSPELQAADSVAILSTLISDVKAEAGIADGEVVIFDTDQSAFLPSAVMLESLLELEPTLKLIDDGVFAFECAGRDVGDLAQECPLVGPGVLVAVTELRPSGEGVIVEFLYNHSGGQSTFDASLERDEESGAWRLTGKW